jgi:hypothetical protein
MQVKGWSVFSYCRYFRQRTKIHSGLYFSNGYGDSVEPRKRGKRSLDNCRGQVIQVEGIS